ncbi:MAG TPA: DsrE/DsrF/DrsH-like family protein [Pseudomonadota bacterium]|nr:DsrE/DsrF/DrsH-like family protein [Pseudomonadota bacterium]
MSETEVRSEVAALTKQIEDLQARLARVESQNPLAALPMAQSGTATQGKGQVDRLSMVVFSGTLDHAIAAFTIATAAAASGMEVEMFFTFWGFAALRDPKKNGAGKSLIGRMFGWMLPRGTRKLPLSQWNMNGAGAAMIRNIMKSRKVASVEELLEAASDLGVTIFACEMSMGLMGISKEEIIDYPTLKICGAATFIERASAGKVTLFI